MFSLPKLSLPEPNGPIDAVIAWVDGADPAHAQARARYLHRAVQTNAKKPSRFRNNDEIRYCLRSLRNHAPWLRYIWLITDNQFPHSINREKAEAEGIRVVDHREVFAGNEEFLPTFNSLSIETFLWRISGLSDCFLYFNDDVLLTAPVEPSDFFHENRVVLRGKWKNRMGGKKRLSWNDSNQLAAAALTGFTRKHAWAPAHVVHPLRRDALEILHQNNKERFELNAKPRFRKRSQWWSVALHNNYLILNEYAELVEATDVMHFSVGICKSEGREKLRERLTMLAEHRARLTCLNLMEEILKKVPNAYTYIEEATGSPRAFEIAPAKISVEAAGEGNANQDQENDNDEDEDEDEDEG